MHKIIDYCYFRNKVAVIQNYNNLYFKILIRKGIENATSTTNKSKY